MWGFALEEEEEVEGSPEIGAWDVLSSCTFLLDLTISLSLGWTIEFARRRSRARDHVIAFGVCKGLSSDERERERRERLVLGRLGRRSFPARRTRVAPASTPAGRSLVRSHACLLDPAPAAASTRAPDRDCGPSRS